MEDWSVGAMGTAKNQDRRGVLWESRENRRISCAISVPDVNTPSFHYSIRPVSFRDTHRHIANQLCPSDDSQCSIASRICPLADCLCPPDAHFHRFIASLLPLSHPPPCAIIPLRSTENPPGFILDTRSSAHNSLNP
jgi:hypothetical protein